SSRSLSPCTAAEPLSSESSRRASAIPARLTTERRIDNDRRTSHAHAEDDGRLRTEVCLAHRRRPVRRRLGTARTLPAGSQPHHETILNPEAQFPGGVWLDLIATPHVPEQRATMAKVRFQPGARTAWHSHARGQFLHVTDGVARFGDRAGNIIEVHPGQTLYT